MSIVNFRAYCLFQFSSFRNISYRCGTIRCYSKGKVNPHVISKHNKEFKEIYEFLRRPELQAGDLKVTKHENSGIAFVTIDFGPKRNAFSGSMIADLWDAVQELSQWNNGRAVVLRGANGVFCSGADMDFVRHPAVFSHEGGRRMSLFMSTTLAALRALPLTSVALVERAAVGGGAELAGAADFRVFTEDAVAGYIQSTLSITPGWGGASRLVSLVGPTRALELLLSGRRFTAREGLQIGYVQHIIPKSPTFASPDITSKSSSPKTTASAIPESQSPKSSKPSHESPHQMPAQDPVLAACLDWLNSIVGGSRRPEVVRAIKSTVHAAEEAALPIDAAPLQFDEIARFAPMWSTPAHRASIEIAMRAIQTKKPKPKQ